MAIALPLGPAGPAMHFVASADLSAKQFYIIEAPVAAASAGNLPTATVCNAAGDTPWGILQDKPESGQVGTVWCDGVSKVVSDGSGIGASIDPGDFVGTDGSGKAVLKDTDADYIIGKALEASDADGTVIKVQLLMGQRAS